MDAAKPGVISREVGQLNKKTKVAVIVAAVVAAVYFQWNVLLDMATA